MKAPQEEKEEHSLSRQIGHRDLISVCAGIDVQAWRDHELCDRN